MSTTKKASLITQLNHKEARKYFLRNDTYLSFDLPTYFNFEPLLKSLSNKVGKKDFPDLAKSSSIKLSDNDSVNYCITYSKDGRFDWRPLEIINPLIYVWIVNQITIESNWKIICERINHLQRRSKIQCQSLNVVSWDKEKNLAKQIKKWLEDFERASTVLSLNFDHIIKTDISNCYGSIYTHNIPRAIFGKIEAKNHTSPFANIGNRIDTAIQRMSFGQTNGIPQGSRLMDFIAEIVLVYFDEIVSEALLEAESTRKISNDYCILRYRDDYRIFCNNLNDGSEILRILSKFLAKEGIRLNVDKTATSSNVIESSIKSDKWYIKSEIFDQDDISSRSLQIFNFSNKFPNSGGLVTILDKFLQQLRNKINKQKIVKKDIEFIISIFCDIEKNNPRTYSISTAIISELIALLNRKRQEEILNKIASKFTRSINTELQELWLQRIFMAKKMRINFDSGSKLVKGVMNKSLNNLWDLSWIKNEYINNFRNNEIFDLKEFKKLSSVIKDYEFNIFNYDS